MPSHPSGVSSVVFLLLSANRPYSIENSHLGVSSDTKVHNKQIP